MSTSTDRAILNSIFNPLLPIGEFVYSEDIPKELKDVEENTSETEEAKEVELKAVKEAENGNTEAAIKLFTMAIEMAPNRASGYNNRAQAHRLKGNVEEALNDLEMAIKVSGGKGKAACQAYTQRAMIKRLLHKDEEARADFKAAADLGSEFAKAQMVQMNPYAAMCNKMLHHVFKKLQQGENAQCS